MKDFLIGYTNPTSEPDVDNPERREKVFLSQEELEKNHIHGVGATRSGKSKWIEGFCRELVRKGTGFTLIDPQGALAEALISYFAYSLPSQPVIYFNPSRKDYLVPFNPFRSGKDEASKRVDKQVEATLKVWGVENTDDTPRLGRWLRCVYHLFATGHICLNEVNYLLTWTNESLRNYAVEVLKDNPLIQNEWLELLSYKRPQDFANQIESVRNRLFRFAEPRQIRRIMSLEEKTLDFSSVFDKGAIVIVNLQESDTFSEENAKLIGTLMINELWASARSRQIPPDKYYYLLIDEVQKFLTPDIKEILDRGAGKGLHLGVFHQHLEQFKSQDPWTFESVMTNAKIKLVFGGLTKADALLMGDEIFAGQIQYDEIKSVIEQTKFWPVAGRAKVYTTSRTQSTGRSSGSSSGIIISADGEVLGESNGGSENESYSESFSEGESDVPIVYHKPFTEISSKEHYTLEEQKNRLADQLKEQYQRHYFLKRPGLDTVPVATPFIKEFRVLPKREQELILNRFIKPYALDVKSIDQQLESRLQKLGIGAKKTVEASYKETEEPLTFKDTKKPKFFKD